MESKNKNELTEKIKASILKNIKNNVEQSSSNGGYKKSNANSEGSSLSESQNQPFEKTGSNQSMKEPKQKEFSQHSGSVNEDRQESNAGPMKSRLDAGRQKMQEKTREIKNRAMEKVKKQERVKKISRTMQGRKEQMKKINEKAKKQVKSKFKKVAKTRAKIAAKRAAANAAKKLALKAIKQAAMQAIRMIIVEVAALVAAAIAALGWWVILIIIVIVIIVVILAKYGSDLGLITLAGAHFLGFI